MRWGEIARCRDRRSAWVAAPGSTDDKTPACGARLSSRDNSFLQEDETNAPWRSVRRHIRWRQLIAMSLACFLSNESPGFSLNLRHATPFRCPPFWDAHHARIYSTHGTWLAEASCLAIHNYTCIASRAACWWQTFTRSVFISVRKMQQILQRMGK